MTDIIEEVMDILLPVITQVAYPNEEGPEFYRISEAAADLFAHLMKDIQKGCSIKARGKEYAVYSKSDIVIAVGNLEGCAKLITLIKKSPHLVAAQFITAKTLTSFIRSKYSLSDEGLAKLHNN